MRNSLRIALSLGLLAMALGGPALAASREDGNRAAKSLVVRQRPNHAAIPITARAEVVDKGLSSSVGTPASPGAWKDALMRLASLLRQGSRF